MAGIFRFSNAVSDIDKFISTYKSLYANFKDLKVGEYFDHSDAAKFMTSKGLASSLGAIGEEALRRSTRDDKSRDPLYNQLKAYSEIFRMLGWYQPGSKKTNCSLTEYGEYIYEEKGDVLRKLFALNTLHIVSPNPLTSVKGNNILRPFPLIIKLMAELDGLIHRDEIILAVLACDTDRNSGVVKGLVEYIRALRGGGKTKLDNEISALKSLHNINSSETLPNYTRFPIAALKWNGWAQSVRKSGIYGSKSCVMLEITDKGKVQNDILLKSIDIRYEDLQPYKNEEIASFVIWSNLFHLEKVGYDLSSYERAMLELQQKSIRIFNDMNIGASDNILFFGYQEAPREILQMGNNILDQLR